MGESNVILEEAAQRERGDVSRSHGHAEHEGCEGESK